MNNWELIASSFGLTTITLTAIGAFAREWILKRLEESIKSEYKHKLESYKAELKHTSDVEIENLKSRLAVQAAERNTRFSRIFEKTADVIAKTHGLLIEAERESRSISAHLARGEEQRDELLESNTKKWAEFFGYYELNGIYIPNETKVKIEEFANAVTELPLNAMLLKRVSKESQPTGDELSVEKFALLFEKISLLRTALENEFQKQLGFSIDDTTPASRNPKVQRLLAQLMFK
jgi:hypothetical protein